MMVPDNVVDVTVIDEGRKAVEVAVEASEVVAAFLVEAEVSSGMMTSSLSMNDMPLLATIFFSSALTLGKANEIAFLEEQDRM